MVLLSQHLTNLQQSYNMVPQFLRFIYLSLCIASITIILFAVFFIFFFYQLVYSLLYINDKVYRRTQRIFERLCCIHVERLGRDSCIRNNQLYNFHPYLSRITERSQHEKSMAQYLYCFKFLQFQNQMLLRVGPTGFSRAFTLLQLFEQHRKLQTKLLFC